jgi:hypothetical protein
MTLISPRNPQMFSCTGIDCPDLFRLAVLRKILSFLPGNSRGITGNVSLKREIDI